MGTDAVAAAPVVYRFGQFGLDTGARRLTDVAGTVLPLTGRAFDVLEYLVRHRDRVVSKEELLSAVWPHMVVEENNLSQAVTAIRRALGDSREQSQYVATIAGRGYRFVAKLQDPPSRSSELPASPLAESVTTAEVATRPIRISAWWAAGVTVLLVAGLGIGLLQRETAPTSPKVVSARLAVERPTLAVLPFNAAGDAARSESLAQIVTTLVHDRLAAIKDVIVIGSTSSAAVTELRLGLPDVERRLMARYLLRGSVGRAGNEAELHVQLDDARSGSVVWSTALKSPTTEIVALADAVTERVADSLQLYRPAHSDDPETEINPEACELYVQARALMSTLRASDAQQAAAMLRRATILDPNFARAYLALAQAQVLMVGLRAGASDAFAAPGVLLAMGGKSTETQAEVEQAIHRSLELDPTLGEAWIELAGVSTDPSETETLYRKGLETAPNYSVGYARFSDFLFGQYRKGEAMEMIDRARAIDPLAPALHVRKAFLLMVARSDVPGSVRLLHEALAMNPRFHPALVDLAETKHYATGEFADALRYAERAFVVDPRSDTGLYSAAMTYLDVGDPDAASALAVMDDPTFRVEAMVQIAQYRHELERAAALARSIGKQPWQLGPIAAVAEAVRDEAIVTGNYVPALQMLESQYAMGGPDTPEPRMWSRGLVLVYAHTLMLAGQGPRGRDLLDALMVQVDSESVGRTKDWFSRERATAFAMLGQDDRAIEELTTSVKTGKLYRWWYLADLDPVFEHVRHDPRFQALAAQANEHRQRQRALLEEMRRSGEIPERATRVSMPSSSKPGRSAADRAR